MPYSELWDTAKSRLVQLGYGKSLVLISALLPDYSEVQLVTPALTDSSELRVLNDQIRSYSSNRFCVFFNQIKRLCGVHTSKPFEGRWHVVRLSQAKDR